MAYRIYNHFYKPFVLHNYITIDALKSEVVLQATLHIAYRCRDCVS